MKPCVGALIVFLAGNVLAAEAGRHGSRIVSRNRMANANSAADVVQIRDDNVANIGLKFDAASTDGGSFVYQQRIHGTSAQLNEFVESLTLSQLKQLLGDNYGMPFRFTFVDSSSGNYLGYLAGYFTSSGSVSFDQQSQIPGGGSLPNLPKQPSLAPTVTTITLSGSQSGKIIAAGKVTDSQLQNILGVD
jgi:hypothetical protein